MKAFFSKDRIRNQGPLAILLTAGLLQLVLAALDSEPASVESEQAQEVQLQEIRMVAEQDGWALEKDRTRVFFTNKGPSHWRDVTPPGLNLAANDLANSLTAFYFPDAHHGYIGVVQNGATSLLQTADSGKSWTATPFDVSTLPFGISQIEFLDAEHGWVVLDLDHGHSKYEIALLSTSDGGKTWQKLLETSDNGASSLPSFNTKVFSFTSAQHGWVTGSETTTDTARLFETNDGGKTWRRYPFPALPYAQASDSYGPYFTNANDGTLPITYVSPGDPVYLTTYRTSDGGKNWTPDPVLQTNVATEWNTLTFFNAERGWTLGVDADQKPIIYQTSDGGWCWKILHPEGLQAFTGGIVDLNFETATKGSLISRADDGTHILFETYDAGEHWRILHPHLRQQ